MRHFRYCFLALLCINTILSFSQRPSFVSDSLDNYIAKGLKDWQVPGLAIVIVKDGKIIVSKGYGVKDIGSKQPVDEKTLFFIASNSKLFTGTALAQLEYRKTISLNDKVTKYFPDYQLYDKTSTELVTIKDMLCHRIGTKTFQGDFTFWNSNLASREIMMRMRYLKPVGLFRQDYGYCNSCFLTAGEVIPEVTGKSWAQYVTDSVLTPLEMTTSYASSNDAGTKANIATPYTTSYTNKLAKVPYDKWDNLGPAASILSNVSDLSHWLLFQLDSGQYNGKRVMPWSVLQKTRDINIITGSRKSTVFPIHFRGYGLGVYAADYNGRQIYWHTGGAAGMVSNVCFVPEERLGIAILTNNDNQNFFEMLRYQVLDAYLGVPYVNRSLQQLPGFKRDMQEQLSTIADWRTKVKGMTPPLGIAAYAGAYNNQLYGDMIIEVKDNKLFARFAAHPDLTATLSYMDTGEWLTEYNNIEYGIYQSKFSIRDGKVQSVDIKVNDFVEYDPYTFIKK
ncbi:MAG: serine hydrolase [Chitinophagaceae bacterium]|nr:serine hydrolase [Chitinophagaceae bacterium]